MIYRNVYMPKGQEITATTRAVAAWLWSGRAATVAGLSAAALHGSKWIDAATAVPGALHNVKAAHTTTKIQKIIESQSQ